MTFFHISLLEYNTTKKERVDENATKLDVGKDSAKYKIKTIWDSPVYTKKLELNHLPKLYYFVFWKDYLEEKNILKPALAVYYLKKLINLFYKDHFDKPTVTFKASNIILMIVGLIIRPITLEKNQS